MKGEGDKMRASGADQVVRGYIWNLVDDESGVQRDGKGLRDAVALGDTRSSRTAVRQEAQLKCLCTNARSVGSEEVEVLLRLKSDDLVATAVDHALVECVVLRNVGLAKSEVRTLKFGRANFRLFKELLAKVSLVERP